MHPIHGAGRKVHINRSPHPATLLAIAYLGFISLGLPDTLIGVAWPSVRDTFGLEQSSLGLLFIGTGCSYFLSSFFTGRLLSALGIGLLLATSSTLVALSGFGYALAPAWLLFAACSVLHGLGSGAIDAGLNHYVANHFAARHMTWLHACYGVGATLGPLIMTSVIAWRMSWRSGYVVVAVALLSLSILFALTRRKWDVDAGDGKAADRGDGTTVWQALRHPVVRLQVALFFLYTGLEVTVGQWSFTILTEARHVTLETAGSWVAGYWGSIVAGRVLSGFIVEKMGIDRLLRASILTAVAGTVLFASDPPGSLSALGIALTGLGLASVYPCLMTRTPQRLGPALAAHAIGFQVGAAMIGAAVLPGISGLLAQHAGLEWVASAAVFMALAVYALHEWLLRWPAQRSIANQ
jgi:fucose permease